MSLRHTPAQIFAKFLHNQGIGVYPPPNTGGTWPITIDFLPAEDPKERICCFNVGQEIMSHRLMEGANLTPHVQVRTRSESNQTAFNKQQDIQDAYEDLSMVTRATVAMTNPTRTYYLEGVHVLVPTIVLPRVDEDDKKFHYVQTVELFIREE